jgi:hypothetical protein
MVIYDSSSILRFCISYHKATSIFYVFLSFYGVKVPRDLDTVNALEDIEVVFANMMVAVLYKVGILYLSFVEADGLSYECVLRILLAEEGADISSQVDLLVKRI